MQKQEQQVLQCNSQFTEFMNAITEPDQCTGGLIISGRITCANGGGGMMKPEGGDIDVAGVCVASSADGAIAPWGAGAVKMLLADDAQLRLSRYQNHCDTLHVTASSRPMETRGGRKLGLSLPSDMK
jgi:hypothetical protein